VFGDDVETFEKGYRQFLNNLVAELQGQAEPETQKTPAELEKAYLADPDDPQTAAEYAFVLLRLRRRQQSRKLALQALKKNAKEPLAALVMAQLELRAENNISAIDYLQQALDRKRPNARLLTLLARLKLVEEKYAEAAGLYELGRKKFPYDLAWVKGSAAAYLKLDETDKLVAMLKELSRRDPDNAGVRKKLAELALAKDDYAAAVKYGRMAIHIDVLDAGIHRILGESYRGLKNYQRSIKEFDVAIRLKPADDALEIGLAKTHLAAGHKKDARSLLKVVLKRNPGRVDAKKLLESLE
jgi:tetratricopeptide (TPR) repeat protein